MPRAVHKQQTLAESLMSTEEQFLSNLTWLHLEERQGEDSREIEDNTNDE